MFNLKQGVIVKRLIILCLLVATAAFAAERHASTMIDKGARPSQLVQEAIDSSSANYSSIGAAIDTVLRQQVLGVIFGLDHDTVPVSGETTKACIYVVPATGVTSVTIKNISIIAGLPPNVAGTKIAWAQVKMMDATDSTFKAITSRTVIDTHTTATLKAYRPKAVTIDSTANAILYPNDAVWGYFYVDSANLYTKDLGVMLNLSINK